MRRRTNSIVPGKRTRKGDGENGRTTMDPYYRDFFEDLPAEVRKQFDEVIADVPTDQREETCYELVAAYFGLPGKEQLLAIDLKQYDQLRTYPNDGTDWQLMRDRVMFLQVAVRAGIPWSQVATRTIPNFGSILKPPFEPVCEQLEPSAYQPPTYDTSRRTPDSWARDAEEGWQRHKIELLKQIKEKFDQYIASGALKRFERRRLSERVTKKEPIIDESLAFEMAVKRFFSEVSWADLAEEFPPAGGFRGSPTNKRDRKKKRSNQIRMRVSSLLKHLGLESS